MRYFLTGATGFLGGEVTRQLLEAGHEVVALVRDTRRGQDIEEQGAELVVGDVTEKASMRGAMTGVDGVFHLAAWYRVGVDDPETAERVNVEGTRNVMELVHELEVPKVVYTSTLAVYGDTGGTLVDESHRTYGPWLSTYDRTKWLAHRAVVEPMVEMGLPAVTVLPGVVYGPGDTSDMGGMWRDYLAGELPVVPRTAAYCFGHVEDVAHAHLLAMESGEVGEEYIVAGEPYTLVEAMAIAERITDVPAPRALSPRFFAAAARVSDVVGRVLPVPPEYSGEALRVLAGATYLGDNSKAVRELGVKHRRLEEGLRETLPALAGESVPDDVATPVRVRVR